MHIIYIILYGYTTTPVLIKLTYQCACARVSVQYLLLVAMNHDPSLHTFQYHIDIDAYVRALAQTHDNPRTQVCSEIMCTQNITTESGRG